MSDPAALLGGGLRQPDRRSCGASVLVAARMLVDPSYAAGMTAARFAREALATHHRATGRRDPAGRLQVPWPRALGTPPWAVARALSALTGGGYRTRVARLRPGAAFDRTVAALRSGHPVALYVGSRWLPRHVVLALPNGTPDADPGTLRVYEPSSGRVATITRPQAASHDLHLAGWSHLWLTVR